MAATKTEVDDALATLATPPAAPAKEPEHLVCVQCKDTLPPGSFGPRERERLRKKLVGRCRKCSNKNKFLSDRGIKRSDYDVKLIAQKNCCARCEKPFKGNNAPNLGIWPGGEKKKSRMHGIVCGNCHTAIASHQTSVEQLLVSANYLMETHAPMSEAERSKVAELVEKFSKLFVANNSKLQQ